MHGTADRPRLSSGCPLHGARKVFQEISQGRVHGIKRQGEARFIGAYRPAASSTNLALSGHEAKRQPLPPARSPARGAKVRATERNVHELECDRVRLAREMHADWQAQVGARVVSSFVGLVTLPFSSSDRCMFPLGQAFLIGVCLGKLSHLACGSAAPRARLCNSRVDDGPPALQSGHAGPANAHGGTALPA